MTTTKTTNKTKAIKDAITYNHSGKMSGMFSLSTSVSLNPQCEKNAKVQGSICSKCYASKLVEHRSTLGEKLKRNTELLTSEIITVDEMPFLNALYFRFEAFGDLMNEIQVVNYFNLCKANKGTRFALWSKNPHIIESAMKMYNVKKPSNLNIIYSSLFINERAEAITTKYSFIDKVFTVYDEDTIKKLNIDINCGARCCATCLKCYKKNNIKHISEKLK